MKKTLMLLIIMGFLAAANMAQALFFNGHNYEFVEFSGQSWDDAKSDVSTKLGSNYYLATITSQEEQDFIANTLLDGVVGQYWLGASQPQSEKNAAANWTWVNGEALGYTNWHVGEANDFYGESSEQHLAMWKRAGWDWEWNDEGNVRNISGYIAEMILPVPEPSTISLFALGLVGLTAAGLRKKKK